MINILSNSDHPRRRLTSLATAAALVGAACASAMFIGTSTASAATTADISVSQHISGSATSGATVDSVTVHNAGGSTANQIEAVYLLKTTSAGYSVHSSSTGLCQIIPAPAGYKGMVTCPLGSLASGHSVVDTLTWSGTAGVAFSVTASVGAASPADPKFSNNTNTISTWFGPRADLRLSGTLAAGPTAGTALAVTTVLDAGPNNAGSLQQVVEIKGPISSVHATATTPAASCQIIPAASGFNLAFSCVTSSLATGAKWTLKLTYNGTKGSALTTKSTVTALSPIDPVTANNTQTLATHLHA